MATSSVVTSTLKMEATFSSWFAHTRLHDHSLNTHCSEDMKSYIFASLYLGGVPIIYQHGEPVHSDEFRNVGF
jgi:hypothetical protein